MASASLYNIGAGVASGAAAGSSFGPWGAVIGGAIGGIFGGKGNKKAEKAKRYMRLASQVQQEREGNAAEENYLQQIRTARTARAGSLASGIAAGISTSSLQTSALSSVGSQSVHNINYLAEDRRLFQLYSHYMQKAGAASEDYKSTMGLLSILPSLGKTGAALSSAAITVGQDSYSGLTNAYESLQSWLSGIYGGNTTQELAQPSNTKSELKL